MKIKLLACAHQGFGEYLQREIERLGFNVEKRFGDAAIFQAEFNQLKDLYLKIQCAVSLSLFLAEGKELESFSFKDSKEALKELFKEEEGSGFSIAYLNVKGNENRIALGKSLYPVVGNNFRELLGREFKVNFKEPNYVFQVYSHEESYVFGLRLHKKDLDHREYRVFAHQASFRGDFAYVLLDEAGLRKEDDFLVLFGKDATLPIEAAAYQNARAIRDDDDLCFSPLSKQEVIGADIKKEVTTIEESSGNVRSAKNNAKIAEMQEALDVQKIALDDIEAKLGPEKADLCFVLLGRKDEERLNELYYQTDLVLRKGGRLAVLARPGFDIVVSPKFSLEKEKELLKGQSNYKFYLLSKKQKK